MSGTGTAAAPGRPTPIDDATKLPVIAPSMGVLPTTHQEIESMRPIRPGVERWPVKTGTDDDIAEVKANGAVQTTVEDLIKIPRPRDMMPVTGDFPTYQQRRVFGVETTIYRLDGEIIAYKLENDGDYHLVIQGDSGETMIAECPNPDSKFVAASSPWAKTINLARQQLDQKLQPKPEQRIQKARERARITGVGFFDKVHGQTGVSHFNGIELHPVLGIQWLDG